MVLPPPFHTLLVLPEADERVIEEAWNASPSQYIISGGADSVILSATASDTIEIPSPVLTVNVLSVIIEPPPDRPSPATTFT